LTDPDLKPVRRRRALATASAAALLLAAGLGAAWLGRGPLAEAALERWLAGQGVAADVAFDRVGVDGAAGRVRLGTEAAPDLTVARIEVYYGLIAPWAGGLSLRPSRIVLTEPRLRAAWRDGKLDLGALDRLAQRLAATPPDPDAPSPEIEVRDGTVMLTTPWGPVEAGIDALLQDGRLRRASLEARQLRLDGPEGPAAIDRVRLGAATVGTRLAVRGRVEGLSGAAMGLAGEAATVVLALDAPAAAEGIGPGEGPAQLALSLAAARLRLGGLSLDEGRAEITAEGRLEQYRDPWPAFDGTLAATLTAAAGRAGETRLTRPSAALSGAGRAAQGDEGLVWRLDGPARLAAERVVGPGLTLEAVALSSARLGLGRAGTAVESTGPVSLAARRVESGALTLSDVSGRGRLDLRAGETLIAGFEGGLGGRAAWPLLGAPAAGDAPEIAGMKRALADMAVTAPDVRLSVAERAVRLDLGQTVTAIPTAGGRLTVAALPGRPLFASTEGGGALALTSAPGGPLPALEATVSRWRLQGEGVVAGLQGRAALDFAPAEDLTLTAAGTLTTGPAGLTFRPDGCVAVAAARLELGENDAEAARGALCPTAGRGAGPFLQVSDGGWRLQATVQDGAARLPGFVAAVEDARGPLTVRGGRALSLSAPALSGRLVDLAGPRRFEALAATGAAALTDEIWEGRFDLVPAAAAARAPGPVATALLRHDGRSGVGALTLDTPALTFAPRGLQPVDLTPLGADFIAGVVEGEARFAGRFDWTPAGATSRGVAEARGLAFDSPLGRVEGLNSALAFDSLAPLTTDPGQRLTAEAVAAFAPLNDLALTFTLAEDRVHIEGGRATAAGGLIRVEPFDAPLTPGAELTGALTFEGVELGEILRTLGLGEDIRIDARVSGRLPFTRLADGRLRISGGQLAAVEPGRLSIPRSALSQVSAGGGVPAEAAPGAPPNMVEDLAYQAMENLAYDSLTASIDSVGDGRMRLRFNVDGRHDPPQRQEIRLSWMDVIRRRFADKPLPLPSGTEIDLTLDVDFNADELFADLIALDQARRGAATP
jgi:hypothetical protein